MFSTIPKSFDIFFIIATTATSVTFAVTVVNVIAIPSSTGIAGGMTVFKRVICELVMEKQYRLEKRYERAQQTIIFFDKLNRNCWLDNDIDKGKWVFCYSFQRSKRENINDSLSKPKFWSWFFSVTKYRYESEFLTKTNSESFFVEFFRENLREFVWILVKMTVFLWRM